MHPPSRIAFGKNEVEMLSKCIEYYRSKNIDPPYDGVFQKKYEKEFAELMSEDGYACAVSTGSISCYIALKCLELPKNSKVLLSPVSDSSSLMAIISAGLAPVVVDTANDSYNSNVENFIKAYSSDVSAIYLVHTYGNPADIESISMFCKEKNIKLIEDCSQSPFATVKVKEGGRRFVGNFGDVAGFSTMYRKTLQSSSSGGMVYTKDKELYNKIIEFSDRGRRKWDVNNDPKNVGNVDRISLNYNTNELSSAVGIASLRRVISTNEERRRLTKLLVDGLGKYASFINPMKFNDGCSPFLVPIIFTDVGLQMKDKLFTELDKRGIPYAKFYDCFAHDWQITKAKLSNGFLNRIKRNGKKSIYCQNAMELKSRTFNLSLHEGYTDDYIDYMLESFRILLTN